MDYRHFEILPTLNFIREETFQSHIDFNLDQLDQVVGLSILGEGTYITTISIKRKQNFCGVGKFLVLKLSNFVDSLTISTKQNETSASSAISPSPSGYFSQGWSIVRKGL